MSTYKKDWMALLEQGLSPIEMAYNIMCQLDIDTNGVVRVEVSKSEITISMDYKDMDAKVLRNLKREVKLEVPSWAQTASSSKPLWGEMEVRPYRTLLDGTRIDSFTVYFRFDAAFVCKAVPNRFREEEPSEFAQSEAKRLADMTPEQKIAEMDAKVASLLKVREVQVYDCEPNNS